MTSPTDPRAIRLFDRFIHGEMDRRDFMDQLTVLAGSTAAATTLLGVLRPGMAKAATVAPDDPRLVSERVSYDAAPYKVSGLLTRTKDKAKRPAVIVIHENRGLNAHIEDVARRVALEGFLAFAPDLLSWKGGTPPNEDDAMKLASSGAIDPAAVEPQLAAAVPFLKSHPESTGKVGAVGFCWGGGMVDRLAMAAPDLNAAVAYYGPVPNDTARVPQIAAPLLLHYAGLDERINAGVPAWEAALKAAGKKYTVFTYPNVNHAFNNDTAGPRYDKAAADLAWGRSIAFFRDNLGTPPKM